MSRKDEDPLRELAKQAWRDRAERVDLQDKGTFWGDRIKNIKEFHERKPVRTREHPKLSPPGVPAPTEEAPQEGREFRLNVSGTFHKGGHRITLTLGRETGEIAGPAQCSLFHYVANRPGEALLWHDLSAGIMAVYREWWAVCAVDEESATRALEGDGPKPWGPALDQTVKSKRNSSLERYARTIASKLPQGIRGLWNVAAGGVQWDGPKPAVTIRRAESPGESAS